MERMLNNNIKKHSKYMKAIVIATMALLFLISCNNNVIDNISLIIYNSSESLTSDDIDSSEKNGANDSKSHLVYATYPLKREDTFSIEFIHSVNKSPVIEYYKFDNDFNIYVYKTVYYNFGAGVPTELNGHETLSYSDDGAIIIDNIDKKIDNLTYYLSNIYDHILKINDGDPISLWETCGKNKMVTIKIIKS